MLAEVADKIPHPSLPDFWFISLTLAAVLGALTCWARRAWMGIGLALGVALCWLTGMILWSADFFVDADIISISFVNEVGRGYFFQVLIAASIPAVAVLFSLGRSTIR